MVAAALITVGVNVLRTDQGSATCSSDGMTIRVLRKGGFGKLRPKEKKLGLEQDRKEVKPLIRNTLFLREVWKTKLFLTLILISWTASHRSGGHADS